MSRKTRVADLIDGPSNTLGMAEVKTFTPYWRDGGLTAAAGAAVPNTPADLTPYFSGEFKVESGHTAWVGARAHQTGFTTPFAPNTKVPYTTGHITYDVDFNSLREGRSAFAPTYAAVTSRSHHTNGVNVLLVDGSVRFVASGSTSTTWRALGTTAGGEVVGDF